MSDKESSVKVSGLCAKCERKFDVLYRKGRLYYCKECLKSLKFEEIEESKPSLASNAHFRKTRKKLLEEHPELMYGIPKEMRRIPIRKVYRDITKDKFKKNSSRSNLKSYKVILLLLPLCVLIPSYTAFSSQEVRIIDIWVDNEEIFSGDDINLYVTLNRYTQINLGYFLDWLNDLFGHVDKICLNLDGEVIAKREIVSRFNENITYSFSILEKEPGIHKVSVGNVLEEFEVLNIARFEGSGLEIFPENPWIAERMNVSINIKNIGGLTDEKEVHCYIKHMTNEDLPGYRVETVIGKTKVSLDPNHSDVVSFYFNANVTGLYDVSVFWETGSLNSTFVVDNPIDPLDRSEYYYSFARSYVRENYNIPENKYIDDLVDFLDQLELPEYEVRVFDCSDASSLLEWLLEGAGFHAYVCTNSDHAWVQVETRDGIIAIEAVELTEGWGHSGSIKPWGIVEKPDGSYQEFTYNYQRFLDWKKKYSSPKYVWDRNITFDEWKSEYLIPVFQPLGIPTKSGYYTESRHESPSYHSSISEYNWWHVYPYSEIFPFSEWGSIH